MAEPVKRQFYNILAVDGGGIRGIIPGVVMKRMEKYAYEYAISKGYKFPRYPGIDDRIALKDLFDMMAGTSTGSILVSGLAYPDKDFLSIKKPQFFADDLLKIYTERGGEIFLQQGLRFTHYFVFIIIFAVVFCVCGYLIGNMLFDSSRTRKAFVEMRKVIHKEPPKKPLNMFQRMLLKMKDRINDEVSIKSQLGQAHNLLNQQNSNGAANQSASVNRGRNDNQPRFMQAHKTDDPIVD